MALELQSAQMHLCPMHYPLQDSLECLGSYKQIFCEEARSQSMKPEEAIDQTLCYTAPLCWRQILIANNCSYIAIMNILYFITGINVFWWNNCLLKCGILSSPVTSAFKKHNFVNYFNYISYMSVFTLISSCGIHFLRSKINNVMFCRCLFDLFFATNWEKSICPKKGLGFSKTGRCMTAHCDVKQSLCTRCKRHDPAHRWTS